MMQACWFRLSTCCYAMRSTTRSRHSATPLTATRPRLCRHLAAHGYVYSESQHQFRPEGYDS